MRSKNFMLLAPAALLAFSMTASADLSNRLTLKVNSNFSTFAPVGDLGDATSTINHIEVIGGALITDGVRAVLRAEFEDSDLSDIEIENAIREAKIEIQLDQMDGDFAQTVRAVITGIDVGVIQAVYGTNASGNPVARSTQRFFNSSEGQEGVVGMTLTLNTAQLALVDEVKMSIYNTGSGDGIDTDGDTAVSVALAKQIDDFRVEFAARWVEDQDEIAAELGIVYAVNDQLQVWGIAHKFDENDSADYGYTVGASYDLPQGSVFVELQADNNEENTVVAGYQLPEQLLPRGMSVTTWVSKSSEDDDARVGVDVAVSYQALPTKDFELD
jgi:hypothetical protein